MGIRNRLLRGQLEQAEAPSDPMADSFELPQPYRHWAFGVRSLLRLRYLALKRLVLMDYRRRLRYTVTEHEIRESILTRLRAVSGASSLWRWLLRPAIGYPLLLLSCAAVAVALWNFQQQLQTKALFRDAVPQYSDLVYQLKVERIRRETAPERLREAEAAVDTARTRILSQVAHRPELQRALASLLAGVAQDEWDSTTLIAHAREVNLALFDQGLPYYIGGITETSPCADLLPERFFERLFGDPEQDGPVCRTHALMTFQVVEVRYYDDGQRQHRAFFNRRLDHQELNESILGRVHIGDDSAEVLLSNIEGASHDSLTLVDNGALRSRLMPQGMPDVYGLESLARRLQSNLIDEYVEELNTRWSVRLRQVVGQLTARPISPLSLAAARLQGRFADVTAFHEVQHLVDQAAGIKTPAWFDQSLDMFGKRVDNETLRRHILLEFSAFFAHLAYSRELSGVLLNEFTAITLNPMLQDQPHFYSIRLLLPLLHQMQSGSVEFPLVPARSLAEVARAYKALAIDADAIAGLARDAYREVFGVPLPTLTEVRR